MYNTLIDFAYFYICRSWLEAAGIAQAACEWGPRKSGGAANCLPQGCVFLNDLFFLCVLFSPKMAACWWCCAGVPGGCKGIQRRGLKWLHLFTNSICFICCRLKQWWQVPHVAQDLNRPRIRLGEAWQLSCGELFEPSEEGTKKVISISCWWYNVRVKKGSPTTLELRLCKSDLEHWWKRPEDISEFALPRFAAICTLITAPGELQTIFDRSHAHHLQANLAISWCSEIYFIISLFWW